MKKHINIIGNILLLMMILLLPTTAKAQSFTSCVGGNPIYLPNPNVPSPYTLMWAQYSYAGSELYVVNNKVTIEKYFVGTIYVECYYKCVRQYTVAGHVYEDHQTNTTYFGIKCDPVYTTSLPNQLTMQVGETKTVDWSYSPSYVSRPNLTWTSSDYSVVDVNSNKLTAKKSGRAVVTVKSNAGPDEYINVTVEGGSDVIYVNSISLNETSVSLTEGSTKQLQATVLPSNATDKSVSWSSSNNSVAQVSSSGLVTAESIGTATITCKANDGSGASATCSITVNSSTIEPTSISLPASKTVKVGESFTITYTLTPSNAATTLTWSSDDTNIATVSSSGVVKGIKVGTTKIRVKTTNGKTDYCDVTVEASSKVKLMLTASPSGGQVSVGTTVTLTAKANGSAVSVWKNDGSHGVINWSGEYRFCLEGSDTDNYCIAEFPQEVWDRIKSETFYVIIRGDNPEIYVSSGWWSHKWTGEDIVPGNELLTDNGDGTYTLTVNFADDPLLDVLDERHLLFTGSGYTIEEIYFDNTVTGADIYYTLNGSNPSRNSTPYSSSGITINSDCTLKAIAYKDGYETSDISSWNYSLKKETINPTLIVVSPSSKTIGIGESFYASYSITPSNANYKTKVTWNSENEDIATVDSYGIIVGKKVGQTYINAITENGKTHWCKVTVVSDLNDNDIIAVSVGDMHSLALKRDGSLWAFGSNEDGQLGDGSRTDRYTPVKIMSNVAMMSASGDYSLILKKDGSLWGCGYNSYGRLGNDDTSTRITTPAKIMDDVSTVAAGGFHVLAVKTDGSLWTWGHNEQGQLGDGTTTDRSSTMKIMDNVASVAGGSYKSYIIKKDGSLWACGWLDGRANYSWNYQLTPKKIMDNVKSVSAGTGSTLVVKTDGSLWGFGSNDDGQLGDGSTEYKENPVKIMDGVLSASTCRGSFFHHSLIVKDDHTLWACGSNFRGQLGDGTEVYRLTPKKIMEGVASAVAAETHSLIAKTDGSLWTCGGNSHGQLGDGSTKDKNSPIQIDVSDIIEPTDIDITGLSAVEVGKTTMANYSLKPEKAETTVTWTSDTPDIALVLPSGEVKGIKTGQAVIRAITANGLSSKAMVDVYFMGKTEEGVDMKFQVIDDDNKRCTVGTNWHYEYAINQSTQGKITIPEKINGYEVVKIGGMAFYDCKEITSISIPKTVSQMESWGIFNCCDKLETIYSFIEKPTNMTTDAFMLSDWQYYSNAILYVPYGTKSMYESTNGWKNIRNIVEMAPPTIEIMTSSAGYATFYDSRSAYILPYNLSAIVVTNVSNSKLTYKTIADGAVSDVIPKGTAVMLVSGSKQAGTYTLASSESTATYNGTNLLHGSDEATTTTGDGYHYKLSYGPTGTKWDNVFGWYWGANDGAPFQIEEHKAWLVVPRGNGTRAAGFTIEGDLLGIESLEDLSDTPSDLYFDLQGRRLSQPTKRGVYIKNGMKVIFK